MTPDELEKLPKPLERTMTALELSIMAEIVERIKEAAQITPVTDWLITRLIAIGNSKVMIKKIIGEAIKTAEMQIDEIYRQAARSDYVRNREIYEAVGRDYLPYEDNNWLQQAVEAARRQTKDSLRPMENITQTTGFNVQMGHGKKVFTPLSEYLERSLDKAMLGITTGAKTYSQAIGEVIDEMTASGIRTVDYASGKSDRIEVAARRAVMTGVAQMTKQVSDKNAEELGTDHWEVDWHMGARNTGTGYLNHQSWQGKVYSTEEIRTICGEGEMLGFAGINCYHIKSPFLPGISKRKYTDEWLAEQNRKENEKKPYRGREYDTYGARQYHRRLERTIRKQKQDVELLKTAGADKKDIMEARSRLRLTDKHYVDFSKQFDLPQQRERLRIANKGTEGEHGITSKKGASGSESRVDLEYINSSEYKAKFSQITDNAKVNESIYQRAKAMLTHRSGTDKEDMYLLDRNDGKIIGLQTGGKTDYEVEYNKSLTDAVNNSKPYSLISIHNHSTNRPPTGKDFTSNGLHRYALGVVACHDGTVYTYKVGTRIFTSGLFDGRVEKYMKTPYNMSEMDAHLRVLEEFVNEYGIEWKVIT